MGWISSLQTRRFEGRRRIEDPIATVLKIRSDEYLMFHYKNCVSELLSAVGALEKAPDDLVLELGSAGGVTKELYPYVVTTDIRESPGVDRIVDAEKLPFPDLSVSAIIAKDVFHHLPNVADHLKEVRRVLRPGGKIAYLEPNWNLFSRLLFTFVHPEPFFACSPTWEFDSDDPMFSNQALAYIVFDRDLSRFQETFPDFSAKLDRPHNGLAFVLSGGVYSRNFVSSSLLIRLSQIEKKIPFARDHFGTNRLIVLTKQ